MSARVFLIATEARLRICRTDHTVNETPGTSEKSKKVPCLFRAERQKEGEDSEGSQDSEVVSAAPSWAIEMLMEAILTEFNPNSLPLPDKICSPVENILVKTPLPQLRTHLYLEPRGGKPA
jgi:hypothetical protein